MKAAWIVLGTAGCILFAWGFLRFAAYLYEERCYRRHGLLKKKLVRSVRANP